MNLLQIASVQDTLQQITTSVEPQTTTNALDLAFKGGWLMIVLLVLLLLSVYVLIERTLVINKARQEDSSFMNRIKDYILDGKIETAMSLCRNTNTPTARMVEKGISRLGRPTADVMSAIENQGNIEISKLEKGLPLLATTASGAPMIGFLGTVTGMVKAFMSMASAGAIVDVTIDRYLRGAGNNRWWTCCGYHCTFCIQLPDNADKGHRQQT
jgi:biopolymer transport protein ExbB